MRKQLQAIITVLSLINPAICAAMFAWAVLAEIIWPHFWAIQIILFVLIAIYCTIHELARVIGREKTLRIFFADAYSASNEHVEPAKRC